MTKQLGASLLALSALLLFPLIQQTASSSSSSSSSPAAATSEARGNRSHDSRPSAHIRDMRSRRHNASIIPEKLGGLLRHKPEEGVSPMCAYRVIEGGIFGQLCFRRTLFGYMCNKEDCRTRVALGSLVANLLINGSVLLQWTHKAGNNTKERLSEHSRDSGPDLSNAETSPLKSVFGERHQRAGFELSCWWNGSYTQFECASAQLAAGCRDYMLSELHENIPYRICLRSLGRSGPDRTADKPDCVEFTLPSSGMQDIVIAMTAVGGAICVMLVIICLLVAYITENIMSPATQHTYSYRTHSRH
ncbi:PREDICTED: fibronectin type-III domain-containing transmembrane protein C1orf233 homolog [Cyprinodon variegatus]|uniref:fibronectin type-III domain-containing transmembrane protein C1orf233 homolog n=1 Tax=Cyprinodon variegatus TaxID=28743 RepID=UPI0007424D62|nr:PREDICTED: fibronectin type-III domain-containing transmembrane protein C1orf233 homolog [Cyprinodon variegatus]